MIKIFDLYQKFKAAVNTPQGGFARPGTFEHWANEISLELFRETFKNWEKNQRISDELGKPFLKSINMVMDMVAGMPYAFSVCPKDYEYFSSAYILLPVGGDRGVMTSGLDCMDSKTGEMKKYVDPDDVEREKLQAGANLSEQSIEKVDNTRWGSVAGHKINKPSLLRPFMTQIDGGFKVIPKEVGIIRLNYLRLPQACVFGYTIGTDDQIIFNSAASKDLEWSTVMTNEFIARLTLRYAKFTGNELMYQQGQIEQKDIA